MTDHEKVSLSGIRPSQTNEASVVAEQLVVPAASAGANSDAISGKALVVGGGSGAAIVVLANIFIHDSAIRTAVQGLAPTATLLVTPIYRWIGGEIAEWYNDLKAERKRIKLLEQARQALVDVKKQYTELNNDPNATKAHKDDILNSLQNIEKKVFELNVKGILVIDTTPPR